MNQKVKPIPQGYHSLTPHFVVKGLPQAIEYYKKAFGATEKFRFDGPDGKCCHAEVQIGDSLLMMCEESPEWGSLSPLSAKTSGVTLQLYVEDVDTVFARALKAGAKSKMPVADMFWGDRYGQLIDPFGHTWAIATHTRDLTPEQIKKEQEQFFLAAAK